MISKRRFLLKLRKLKNFSQGSQCVQYDQVPIVGEGEDVQQLSGRDIREALLGFA